MLTKEAPIVIHDVDVMCDLVWMTRVINVPTLFLVLLYLWLKALSYAWDIIPDYSAYTGHHQTEYSFTQNCFLERALAFNFVVIYA